MWVMTCGDAMGHHAFGPYSTAEAAMQYWTYGEWHQDGETIWRNSRDDFDWMQLERLGLSRNADGVDTRPTSSPLLLHTKPQRSKPTTVNQCPLPHQNVAHATVVVRVRAAARTSPEVDVAPTARS